MLTLVVFKLTSGWVEEIREDLGVLSVVFHPVVENCVCRSNETSNDVGDREDGSIEFFGFSVFVHLAQNVCHDVSFPRDVVNGEIELLLY